MAEQRDEEAIKAALQGWHQAQSAARRYDRNILQCAAGIAAILGIGAGSGGIFAVANALPNSQSSTDLLVVGIIIVAAIIVTPLFVYLVLSWKRRVAAERLADNHLGKLIRLDPDRFWPEKAEV